MKKGVVVVRSVIYVMVVWCSAFISVAYGACNSAEELASPFAGVLTALKEMELVCINEGSEKESGFYVMTKEAMEECCDDFSMSLQQLRQELVVVAKAEECWQLRQLLLEGDLIQAQKMQQVCEEDAKRMQEGLLRVCAMQRKKIVALQKVLQQCNTEKRLAGEAGIIEEDWLLTEQG